MSGSREPFRLAFQGLKRELITNKVVSDLVEQRNVEWAMAKHIGLVNPKFHEITLDYKQKLLEQQNTQIESEEIKIRKSWQYYHFESVVRDAFTGKTFKINGVFFVCERSEKSDFVNLEVTKDD